MFLTDFFFTHGVKANCKLLFIVHVECTDFSPMIPLLNACCNLNNFFLKISQVILPVEDKCPGILWRENALSWHSFAA